MTQALLRSIANNTILSNDDKQKGWARRQTLKMVAEGHLKRLPCLICGEEDVECHHADYSNPANIYWLCVKHHRQLHFMAEKIHNVSNRSGTVDGDGPYTITKAAYILGLSRQRVHEFVKNGQIAATSRGSSWVISRSAIEDLKAHKQANGRYPKSKNLQKKYKQIKPKLMKPEVA